MIVLIDTSVWVDHLRAAESKLTALLAAEMVAMHPFVLGELALGNLHDRTQTIAKLGELPLIAAVADSAWLALVEVHRLPGSGLGFVDAHLLASAVIGGFHIWTRDRRLADQAERLGRCWRE